MQHIQQVGYKYFRRKKIEKWYFTSILLVFRADLTQLILLNVIFQLPVTKLEQLFEKAMIIGANKLLDM